MKRVTASDARKNWFRLLDEVAAGEVVCIERRGRRILLRRELEARELESVPDYSAILQSDEAARAEEWGWVWDGPEGDVHPGRAGEPDGG